MARVIPSTNTMLSIAGIPIEIEMSFEVIVSLLNP
jgi:hypothetical protein